MGAAAKNCDYKMLSTLIPLNMLDADKCTELAQKSQLRQYKPGERIFRMQSDNHHRFYLISGAVDIITDNQKLTLKAGTPESLSPITALENKQAQLSAKTGCSVLVVDNDLLDLLLNWNTTDVGYEVDEINAEHEGDWSQVLLQNQTLLQLAPNNIQAIMACIEPINVKAGQTVIQQGDTDSYYYIISRGKCRVTQKKTPRSKERFIAELNEGDAFGEEALISDTQRNATITMSEDGLLLRLSRNDFSQFLKDKMLKYVAIDEAERLINEGAQWVDIRSPEEHGHNGIGINMPLSSVRITAQELSNAHPYVLYCNDGNKSATAAFLMRQLGLDVYVLFGGLENNNILEKSDAPHDNLYYLHKQEKNNNDDKEQALRKQIANLKTELQQANKNSQQKLEESHTHHTNELNQYLKLNKDLKTQSNQYKSQISALEKIITESDRETKSLNQQISTLKEQLCENRDDVNTKEGIIATVNVQLKNLEEHNQALSGEITQQSQTITDLDKANKALESQLDHQQENIDDLNKKLSDALNETQELAITKQQLDEKITSLENNITKLNETIALHCEAIKDSSDLTDELQASLNASLEEIEKKDTDISQLQSDVQCLSNDLDLAHKEIGTLSATIKELDQHHANNELNQQQYADLEQRLSSLQNELSASINENEQLKAHNKKLDNELTALQSALQHETELQDTVKQLTTNINETQKINTQFLEEKQQLTAQITEMQNAIDTINQQLASAEQRANVAEQTAELLEFQLNRQQTTS